MGPRKQVSQSFCSKDDQSFFEVCKDFILSRIFENVLKISLKLLLREFKTFAFLLQNKSLHTVLGLKITFYLLKYSINRRKYFQTLQNLLELTDTFLLILTKEDIYDNFVSTTIMDLL